MFSGSSMSAAYLVMPLHDPDDVDLLVPELPHAQPGYEPAIISRLTCPETTTIGIESVQAPKTPFSALIPPGPVVTQTDAGQSRRRARTPRPPSRPPARGGS